jgi:DNA-binding response OmpR family regulator
MRILIADDQEINRRLLRYLLEKEGHTVLEAEDGAGALDQLSAQTAPSLAVLDWEMPAMDGPEVCRRVRSLTNHPFTYLILLTVRNKTEDIVEGLHAGADDYVVKPFDRKELTARVRIGARMADLQRSLVERVAELEAALAQINQLRGLLPICAYCKKIRDDQNYWQEVEHYIGQRSDTRFTHGICPTCYAKVMAEIEKLPRKGVGS